MDKIFTKNHLLDFINPQFETESIVNPDRYKELFKSSETVHNKKIIYLMNRNFRIEDNFTLNFALQKANEKSLDLEILIFLDASIDLIKQKHDFLFKNLEILKKNLDYNKLKYTFLHERKENLKKVLMKENPEILITDFNPVFHFFSTENLKEINLNVIEADSYNITPARVADESQAYNAASLRHKIYKKIYNYLTEFPQKEFVKNEGYTKLYDFINIKLQDYAMHKNNPVLNVVSELSPYITRGFLSSQRVALEVIKSDNSRENKESFLEELVIRKELADNFCLYAKDFKSFDSLPFWAKSTLKRHKNDMRRVLFSLQELEEAKTDDLLWNASQNQLKREGKIHGYMRMYWAKTLAYWSTSAQEAIDKAIYLNDKYAFDAPSANGYTGILWSIGGLHDRAFQDYPVTGKIRRMTYNGAKRKFDTEKYIKRYS